jgi:hypothetical protein
LHEPPGSRIASVQLLQCALDVGVHAMSAYVWKL